MIADLSLCSTESLIEALEARCDAAVVLLEFKDGVESVSRTFYKGGYSVCLGMLIRMKADMLAQDRQKADPKQGEWTE